MKHLFHFALSAVAVLLLSTTVLAQKFEGVITMEISLPKTEKPMTLVSSTKGDKSLTEIETPRGNMKMYLDQSAGKMTTVMEAMKIGMVMDLNKSDEKKPSDESEPPTVLATEEKKVISGYRCERYHVTTHKGDQSDWWMTNDLPKSMLNTLKAAFDKGLSGGMYSQRRGPIGGAVEEMFKKGLVPVKVESIKDGKPETTVTFVKFEKKHLDDSIFIIPSDIKMISSMGGMGGGQ